METIARTVHKLTGTLAPAGSQPRTTERKSPSALLDVKPKAQLGSTHWQRKWLKLDCYNQDLRRLAATAQEFCGRFYRNDKSTVKKKLVLIGPVGCGKTHCAKAVSAWASHMAFSAWDVGNWPKTPHVQFVHWPEIAAEISAGDSSSLDDMFAADLLILDDIGAEHDPWKKVTDKLCQVLSRRENKWTVITSNVEQAEWPKAWDKRVADRLCGRAEIIILNVESYRLK